MYCTLYSTSIVRHIIETKIEIETSYEAENRYSTSSRLQNAHQHRYWRWLAGAVWPQQTSDLVSEQTQWQPANGFHARAADAISWEHFTQASNLNRRLLPNWSLDVVGIDGLLLFEKAILFVFIERRWLSKSLTKKFLETRQAPQISIALYK